MLRRSYPLIPMHYSIKKILDLPFYTEGPVADGDGNFLFTTLTGGFIGKIGDGRTYSVWAQAACPNGQVVLKDGSHLVCDSKEASIKRFDKSGNFIENKVQGICAGTKVYCPNDLITDTAGNIYFTDSVRETGKVFFQGSDGIETVVAENMDYPNGLVLSGDGKQLFVAESYQNWIMMVPLAAPGIVSGKPEVFARLPAHFSGEITGNLPDGLALDQEGNLWAAHYGMSAVQVLSPEGNFLFSIDTTLPLTSNLCFVQENELTRTILVTGGYGEPGPGAVLMITVYLQSLKR
ncbi:SMP-30/gluconolactonase/LRE family protein [Dyadobacter bucti]|uniref:SMP-30/gluconolactonase/LRE family protein n=1 Tax=Dyadobacter bucti TaxID=2572203 RepID=UPI003F6F0F45